jgi:hypothetical protein
MSAWATSRHAPLNSQQVDAWKFVESGYDRKRAHERTGVREMFALRLAIHSAIRQHKSLPHQITIQQSDFVMDFVF